MTVALPPQSDAVIRVAILDLATERGVEKTICPSEVARHVAGPVDAQWRPLMSSIRRLAIELAAHGQIEIKRGGKVVDPGQFEGIYRIAVKKT